MSEPETTQAATGGHVPETGGEFDPSGTIMSHIMDGDTLHLPVVGDVHLPQFAPLHLGPLELDLSITRHVVFMWLAGAILVALFALVSRRFRDPGRAPGGLAGGLEALVLFVRDELAVQNIGKEEGKRYTPFLCTVFFFILVCNLLGLVPWGATATGNISVTASLALLAFILIQWGGIRKYGPIGHFRNLIPSGMPAFVMPIMVPIEILGVFVKPFALAVRLFANMTGGHVALLSLLCFIFIMKSAVIVPVSVAFALFIYLLEIFVSFLQAYIFTMLTSLFIGMSVHPEH